MGWDWSIGGLIIGSSSVRLLMDSSGNQWFTRCSLWSFPAEDKCRDHTASCSHSCTLYSLDKLFGSPLCHMISRIWGRTGIQDNGQLQWPHRRQMGGRCTIKDFSSLNLSLNLNRYSQSQSISSSHVGCLLFHNPLGCVTFPGSSSSRLSRGLVSSLCTPMHRSITTKSTW